MDAPDDLTVRIRMKMPLGPLPNRLTNVPVWRRSDSQGPAQGTGPYRVRSWTPTGDTVLEAVPGYDREQGPWREVVFRAIPDDKERLRLLRAGEVDLIVDAPLGEVGSLDNDPQSRSARVNGLRTLFLGMDCARPQTPHVDGGRNPFADKRVRKALALAVDREALVRGPLFGHAQLADQIVPLEVSGAPTAGAHAYDLAAARLLLNDAGWSNGFAADLDFPTGKYRAIDDVAQALVRQLASLGIRLRPQAWTPERFLEKVEHRDTSLYLLGSLNLSGDTGLSYEYLLHTAGVDHGKDNASGYSNPRLDTLLARASRLAPLDRAETLASVAVLIHEDVPVVPLYRQEDLYAHARALSFTPRVDRRLRVVEMRWLAER
jgi:peptide/nickel transport system substrate-binding protein